MSNQKEERNGSSTPELVKDITPGTQSSKFEGLTGFNDQLYFFLEKDNNQTDTSTYQLWKSNGTENGTKALKTLGDYQPNWIYSWLDDDQFYFTTTKDDGDDQTLDPQQLWVSDGTGTGTLLLKDLGKFSSPQIIEFNNQIYFTTTEYNNKTQTTTNQLWKTNGTDAGTKLVKNFGDSPLNSFVPTEDALYLTTYDFDETTFTSTQELWKTDGTNKGTKFIKDLGESFSYPTEFKDQIYFTVGQSNNTTNTTISQLWKTNGTDAGTQQVKNLSESQLISFYSGLDEDTLYFTTSSFDSNTSTANYDFWKTNGTAKGTQLLKDLGNTFPTVGELKDTIYFTATEGNKNQIWKTDGTQTGTKLVKSLGEFKANIFYSWLDEDSLYFTTVKDDGKPRTPDPYQLWKTNGTAAGTQLIKDLGNHYPYVTEFNDTIYFTRSQYNSKTDTTTYQLWKTDGTDTGTKQVKNLGTSQVDNFYGWLDNNTLYFTTVKDDENPKTPNSYELWKTNGTAAGTEEIQDLGKQYLFEWSPVDSDLYYTAKDPAHGLELWKLEGSNDALARSVQKDNLLNSENSNGSPLFNADDSMLMSQLGINPSLIPLQNSPLEPSLMGQPNLLIGEQEGLGFRPENTLFSLPENS